MTLEFVFHYTTTRYSIRSFHIIELQLLSLWFLCREQKQATRFYTWAVRLQFPLLPTRGNVLDFARSLSARHRYCLGFGALY